MEDIRLKKLGLNIAKYRKLKGLTQLEFSNIVGVSRTHLSNIEVSNGVMPSLELLFRVADALNVEVSELFK